METTNRGLDLERELTCSICTEVLFQPLTLLDCLHTFCGACLKEWFSWQLIAARNNANSTSPDSTPYSCPSCRAPVRGTKHNATVTTLLEMFLAANPDKARTVEEKEELKSKYAPGGDVMPKVEQRERTLRERRAEDEDRRIMNEVRDLSLQQVGVGPSRVRSRSRRREDDRLHAPAPRSSREGGTGSRSAEGRERRRHREGSSDGERRRRRDEPSNAGTTPDHSEARRRRRSQEDTRRRHENSSRTVARQIEHQSSLRSLISSSDVDSHEMEEEILRQIQEEGLLDGIDLDNIDVNQEDQISERIAEAFRRRQSERARGATATSNNTNLALRSGQAGSRDHSGNDNLRASSRHGTHSRSNSATSQADELNRTTTRASSSHLEIQSGDENRRRRRTASSGRSATATVPAQSSETTTSATRSQTDLSSRRHPSQTQSVSPQAPAQSRNIVGTGPQRAAESHAEAQPAEESPSLPSPGTGSRIAARAEDTTAPAELLASSSSSAPSAPISAPASLPSEVSQSSPEASLLPAPLSPHHHHQRAGLSSDSASLTHNSTRPPSSSSTGSRVNFPRFSEPHLTCSQCAKPHIEYELHYNCSQCQDGNWNICISCYRNARGCLHWFGFGYAAAWAKWERLKASKESPANLEHPHMLTANRYIPPRLSPGGADGRRTITSEDPQKRLQSGAFCVNCFAWANECYWRCDTCNEGDWGFCNNCVNQGKCCTHPLLPLLYKPDPSNDVPLSPSYEQQTPSSASLLTGPSVIEYGSFKPLTFRVSCDICHHAIQPTSTRYHCFSCISSLPDRQPGDYDICTKCYHALEYKKRISPENGHNGWRRCLKGHRTIIVGFEDSYGGQRRVIAHDLVGGRGLHEEPSKLPNHSGQNLLQWSWGEGSQVRLVTLDLSASAPTTAIDLTLSTNFPPIGGSGMRALAAWSWYPKEGKDDELLFPKGAELRECIDINGDWFWGVYMGGKGLFPAPYVRVLDK